MRWEDERYVRLYTRDTVTWKLLPWQAKALLPLVLRKMDRAGVVDLDAVDPVDAVCAITDMPRELVEPGLSALMKQGILRVGPAALVMPKFIEAQEAVASDTQRKREQRARDREQAVRGHETGQTVTKRDETSRAVTDGHAESRAVTPSLAVPSRAEPNQKETPLAREKPKTASPQEPKPPPSLGGHRSESLVDRLKASFLAIRGKGYRWSMADEHQLERLKGESDDEIVARWENGLRRSRFPICNSVADLAKHWNAYATEELQANGNGPPSRERDAGKGSAGGRACSTCGEPAETVIHDKPTCYRCYAAAGDTEAA